jgi:hypothetical protein
MNFIQRILEAGFVEQGQKKMLEIMPHKEKWIPKWWEKYPYDQHWFGVCVDHPDAWFTKEGFDGELQLSLQGIQTGCPEKEEDKILLQNRACRYICIKIGKEKIYETFSAKLPPESIVDDFIKASVQPCENKGG